MNIKNSFFKELGEDCMLNVLSFVSGENLEKIKLVEKYTCNLLNKYADIIFFNLIKNKYKFYEFEKSYLFRNKNSGISIHKERKFINKLALLYLFKIPLVS